MRYRELAPHAALAVPTPEHFEPVFVTAGAVRVTDTLTTIFEGFQYGRSPTRSTKLIATKSLAFWSADGKEILYIGGDAMP